MVKTTERSLYYVLGNGKAVRYPVGVGRRGKQWTGTAFVISKARSAASSPTAAFACTMRTCSISTTASAGAPLWL